jgi:hypothetical protein
MFSHRRLPLLTYEYLHLYAIGAPGWRALEYGDYYHHVLGPIQEFDLYGRMTVNYQTRLCILDE